MSRDFLKAMGWAVLGSFLFALMFCLPKLTSDAVPPVEIAFLRYLAGFLTILPFFLHRYGAAEAVPEVLGRSRRRLNLLHMLRAGCGVASVAFGSYAVLNIPVANAQAIAMTNGVFAVALAAVFLRERVTLRDFVAGAICLAGAIVVAGPDPAAPGWISLGAAAALVQAFAWGSEVVLLRFAAVNDTPQRTLTIVNGSAALGLAVFTAWAWDRLPLTDLLILLAMGPIAIFGQYCNILAFKAAETAKLVPIKYSGLVFAALLGLLFFDEWPRPAAILGAAMIVGGALFLARHKPVQTAAAIRP